MDQSELIVKLGDLLDEAGTAVLVTISETGWPRSRWMTPTLLPGRAKLLYAVTMPETTKLQDLTAHGEVEWLVQSRDLCRICSLRGTARVIDNPALRVEVLERLGPKLATFWRVHTSRTDWIVLETRLDEATWFEPMKARREHVKLN